MSVDGLELDLLRRLVLEPRLLGDSDIKDSDFSPGQGREGFAEISAIYEEQRPAEIDPAMLMSRLGGNGAGAFVGSLYDGNIRLGAEFFKDALAELLGVSVKTAYRWAIAGDLPALRIRHTLRIDGAAIEDVYQRQQEEIKGGRRGCSGLPLFLGWPLPANKEGDWSAEIP